MAFPTLRRDWGRLEEGQGEVGSLLQEAGDVIPAARGPHERVGLHGDVSSHQLGRLLPPRAAAVADAVVVHAKPGNRSGTEGGGGQPGFDADASGFRLLRFSRVCNPAVLRWVTPNCTQSAGCCSPTLVRQSNSSPGLKIKDTSLPQATRNVNNSGLGGSKLGVKL